VLALKQGFGRLIRAKTDRGVLALLDTRISRMPYGKIFLESLPSYRTTQNLAEVGRFLTAQTLPETPPPVKRTKRAGRSEE
jgi:ATP-dependent DNA helicase DinG